MTTFTVANTNDSGAGSLRDAINNANATLGSSTIAFNISGGGVQTITLASALPTITNSNTTIDGTTQSGYAGTPVIEINGGSSVAVGLTIQSSGTTIKGLEIGGFTTYGIEVSGASNVTIQGNYIGTNAAGTSALANGSGISIDSGSTGAIIGGPAASAANFISGNTQNGIVISGSDFNTVAGNLIGIAAGNAPLANGNDGVLITNNADNNTIGGSAPGAGNAIDDNTAIGVAIVSGTGNLLQGDTVSQNSTGIDVGANASLVVSTSTVSLNSNLGGIDTGTLELGSGGAIVGNLTFAGTGTLQIDTSVSQMGGSIVGAAGGDAVDLRFESFAAGDQVVWTQSSGSAGIMRLESSTGTTLASLGLKGVYTSAQFSAASDNNSGTVITVQQPVNPGAPGTTTATMIMTDGIGDYEIYDVGGNQILSAYLLGQAPAALTFVGLGTFQAGDSSDMLLRNPSTGAFEAYYVSGNSITGSALVGTVGSNFGFAGIGDFDGQSSLSEMLLRNSNSGSFELYQVVGGGVLSGSSVAAVGNNFTVEGFGNFSESSTTQMMMQGNSGASLGQLELYTYQPGTASFAGIDVGVVGSNLNFVGCADLLGNGSTQMVMQQNNSDIWLYSYNAATNTLSGTEVGAIGSNFHVVGFGPLGSAGQDEMLMQDAAGAFEVYQYSASENAFVGQSMGAVGAPWVVDGIAVNTSGGGASSASTAQLVQAMASFGTAGSSSSAPVPGPGIVEQSQQTLLTTPHA